MSPEESVRIAYSANNQVHLAARRRGEGWKVEDVDADGGELPSLAYDKRGDAHIGYKSGSSLVRQRQGRARGRADPPGLPAHDL